MTRKLFIYTSFFPFSKTSETFLESEILYAESFFCDITIIPVNKASYIRPVPKSITVDNKLANRSVWKCLESILSLLSRRSFLCLFSGDFSRSFKEWVDAIKYCYAANLVYYDLRFRLQKDLSPITLYSYWLTYPPIAFSWIKKFFCNRDIKFVSRAHGSDIYSTDIGLFLPGRKLVLNSLDAIFTVSKFGRDYLLKRYGGETPIFVSRLGVNDNISSLNNNKNNNTICVVSCSSLIQLKRVDLLFSCLNNYAFNHPKMFVNWTHIGNGPLMNDLLQVLKNKHSNFYVDIKGELDNKEILRLYRDKYFDCYILLSESEGVPVSIMEALASGIPVIATNVGGVSEIVNEHTGYLLNKDFTQKDFNEALDGILDNYQLRESAHLFYKQNFNAQINFSFFYQKVANI